MHTIHLYMRTRIRTYIPEYTHAELAYIHTYIHGMQSHDITLLTHMPTSITHTYTYIHIHTSHHTTSLIYRHVQTLHYIHAYMHDMHT